MHFSVNRRSNGSTPEHESIFSILDLRNGFFSELILFYIEILSRIQQDSDSQPEILRSEFNAISDPRIECNNFKLDSSRDSNLDPIMILPNSWSICATMNIDKMKAVLFSIKCLFSLLTVKIFLSLIWTNKFQNMSLIVWRSILNFFEFYLVCVCTSSLYNSPSVF